MARTFLNMKANVADRIKDTTSAMKTLIGEYLNRRMYQVLKATNWSYTNEDYTISVTSSAQDYALASDFGKEIACVDTTNGVELAATTLERMWSDYPSSITTSGDVQRYAVFTDDSGNKKVRFHYFPSASITVAMPYNVHPTEMSGDSDTPVIEISDVIELGAEADAWRYKGKFNKAAALEAQFQGMLSDYIWSEANQPNKVFQFSPQTYDRDDLY